VQLFIVFFMAMSVFAAPKNLQIWFVSHKKISLNTSHLERKLFFSPKVAARECQEMGDYCFDPQVGLYKREDGFISSTPGKLNELPIKLESSLDRDLVTCDEKNYFDIFCGSTKSLPISESRLEVWIDTSSSMREFDPLDSAGSCFRKSFAQRLSMDCSLGKKPTFKVFDTSVKNASGHDSFCQNEGLNDYKKLMDEIERSQAHTLIIITDIYEFTKEFADFVEAKMGTFKGDKDSLVTKDLVDLATDLAKTCQ